LNKFQLNGVNFTPKNQKNELECTEKFTPLFRWFFILPVFTYGLTHDKNYRAKKP